MFISSSFSTLLVANEHCVNRVQDLVASGEGGVGEHLYCSSPQEALC